MDNKKVAQQAKTIIVNKSFVSTAGLITILLVILKVTDNIDISWIWVFGAYWLPLALVLGFMGLFMIGGFIIALLFIIYDAWDTRKR